MIQQHQNFFKPHQAGNNRWKPHSLMELLREKTSSPALIGCQFDMKWNLFKIFWRNHRTRNHQTGKVNMSRKKTKTTLLQNKITYPAPHHLDSSLRYPHSQICTLWEGGCESFPSWRISLRVGMGICKCTQLLEELSVDPCSTLRIWAQALTVRLSVVYIGSGLLWKKAQPLSRIALWHGWDPDLAAMLLAPFLQLQEAALHCLSGPDCPMKPIETSTPLCPSQLVICPYF